MEHCIEDTDLCWDADECHAEYCNGGNCRAIKEQLLYQRKRNQHIRNMLTSGIPSDKDTITAMVKQFRGDYYRAKANQK